MSHLNHWRKAFAISYRSNRAATACIYAITVMQAFSAITVAVAQRDIVNRSGDIAGVTTAALLGGVAYTVFSSGNKVKADLQVHLLDDVELQLKSDVLRANGAIATVDHLHDAKSLNKVSQISTGYRSLAYAGISVVETASSLAGLGFTFWLLFSVNPVLIGTAGLAALPLLLTRRAEQVTAKWRNEAAGLRRQERDLHRLVVSLPVARDLELSGSAEFIDGQISNLWRTLERGDRKAKLRAAAWKVLGWTLFSGGFAAAVLVVTWWAPRETGGLGNIILVISLCSRLRTQIAATVSSIEAAASAGDVGKAYDWFTGYAKSQQQGTIAPPSILRRGLTLEKVTFRYSGSPTPVLSDIDLHVTAGGVLGIVGENGAGKSTLVKLIMGLHRPTAGAIKLDGIKIADYSLEGWSSSLATVFQDYTCLATTVRDSVEVGRFASPSALVACTDALTKAGIIETVETLPEGFTTAIDPQGSRTSLSQGQWQRIALARALYTRTPLILGLDEPNASLDPKSEHDFFLRLQDFARHMGAKTGAVTILVSHRFSTLSLADHIIVLDGGRISEEGTHATLMRKRGTYHRMFTLQTAGYR